jgi:hypothetical protein
MSSKQRKWKRKADAISHTESGITYLFDEAREEIHTLNSEGTHLWELLKSPHSLEELTGKIASLYDVTENQARKDIRQFLSILAKKNLLLRE